MYLALETGKQQQKHHTSTKQQQNNNGGYKETNKNNLKMEAEQRATTTFDIKILRRVINGIFNDLFLQKHLSPPLRTNKNDNSPKCPIRTETSEIKNQRKQPTKTTAKRP